jgi:prevent-host-death family protein
VGIFMAILMAIIAEEEKSMKFVSVAEAKNRLTVYLAQARKKKEAIIVTHHGKPYALIQAISEEDLEGLGWDQLTQSRLQKAWEGEDDALYNYL